jgi:hypothetical protein
VYIAGAAAATATAAAAAAAAARGDSSILSAAGNSALLPLLKAGLPNRTLSADWGSHPAAVLLLPWRASNKV